MPPDFPDDSFAILAVDDAPDNLFLVESILDDPEYRMTCVESGPAALDVVHRSPPPDLILLDVMMPGMDGYAVTQKIRSDASLPYIPILLITAHDQSSLVQGLDAGADDFIRKPMDVNELRARVRSLLRLKRSMDAQADMIRQRDDFVARLTHDLRTPLVAANRMLKLCQDDAFGPMPNDGKEAIATIVDSNRHLLSMVNTLLEVYRHEAGHKALTMSPVNLLNLAETVVTELAPIAAEKSITARLCRADRVETPRTVVSAAALNGAATSDGFTRGNALLSDDAFTVEGDHLELRRVITNLIGNAIKFTDVGHVSVTVGTEPHLPPEVEATGYPRDRPWVSLSVADTGIGIPVTEQTRVFEWFRQGNHARAGHGLGLHLSQRIAKLHNGVISLTSEAGQGSCFTLYLPQLGSAEQGNSSAY
ncbi:MULTISPECIES: hybrid sensor histidine kinase/response regulator [Cyanophyceae]|uniref:ATP-binding response regulator n=1 Tax=Cyanophyceae TaxID=3028117 RepID=UPI0016846C76|nr:MULTISPECIES: hybrid sensor histidine kinase/response regulator [Cyanophyceae]MBD1914941.1 hybrid sensor histidine kinase/response regulator [Phormidium sp. FACHB-77]MBD2028619.1 hybrid sensor histidine kinase/response regulator [Phormidium sp. FACHB-322]MBD2051737.1 hybrid sensor histidine kinase/response regulator [Leptolyngbya sp. FACHB-60]